MNKRTHDEEIELGQEVEARRERPSGPVVAVRVPRDVLARLSEYAAQRSTTVSEVLRQAAISFVSAQASAGPYVVSTDAKLAGLDIRPADEATDDRARTLEYASSSR